MQRHVTEIHCLRVHREVALTTSRGTPGFPRTAAAI